MGHRRKPVPHKSFYQDFLDVDLVAGLQPGFVTAAMGTDSALGNRGVGFLAVVTECDGMDLLNFQLAVRHQGNPLAVPLPDIQQVFRNHRGDLTDLQGDGMYMLRVILLCDLYHAVGNVEHNA